MSRTVARILLAVALLAATTSVRAGIAPETYCEVGVTVPANAAVPLAATVIDDHDGGAT
jgi:hypothetical protein